ncbi:MAG TPA: hypothetical protein VKX49_22180 [Bryobacteraceae bacterium]|nr:hypothetical protein [Bryobacteraceae bacterium]
MQTNWLGWALGLVVCGLLWRGIHTPAYPTLKVVYLVPSDRNPREEFPHAARRAVVSVQRWYFDRLGSRKTFALADPLVETVKTRHSENWYAASAGKRDDREALWSAAVHEAFTLTGGSYNDPRHVWLYFLDADVPRVPAQGTSGVALLLRDDIRSLLGTEPSCMAAGTIAHELGHAFGLKHPRQCDSHEKPDSAPECESVSYLGGYNFPNSGFLPPERDRLLQNSAFASVSPAAAAADCAR